MLSFAPKLSHSRSRSLLFLLRRPLRISPMAIHQQYRIFVYDPTLDMGAYQGICDVWAENEKQALEKMAAGTSRKMTMVETPTHVAMNSDELQFIARPHAKPESWPNVQTGMLPRSDNPVKRDDFYAGRL